MIRYGCGRRSRRSCSLVDLAGPAASCTCVGDANLFRARGTRGGRMPSRRAAIRRCRSATSLLLGALSLPTNDQPELRRRVPHVVPSPSLCGPSQSAARIWSPNLLSRLPFPTPATLQPWACLSMPSPRRRPTGCGLRSANATQRRAGPAMFEPVPESSTRAPVSILEFWRRAPERAARTPIFCAGCGTLCGVRHAVRGAATLCVVPRLCAGCGEAVRGAAIRCRQPEARCPSLQYRT
ncbi:hypothetical protein BJY17_002457 [Agromyces hippuratus]|uniref:Uncharacterized protein n=1 Tax=Agromyces hippuratus TaxID=286438 RepID=A0A852WZS0_9MICO|nr:hypothetical protein [Agromyces hippuratus]